VPRRVDGCLEALGGQPLRGEPSGGETERAKESTRKSEEKRELRWLQIQEYVHIYTRGSRIWFARRMRESVKLSTTTAVLPAAAATGRGGWASAGRPQLVPGVASMATKEETRNIKDMKVEVMVVDSSVVEGLLCR
jgi:hypothetical protein